MATTRNDAERAAHLQADLDDLASERDINSAVGPDGAIDLTFSGVSSDAPGAMRWVSTKQSPAAANCIYLIRAESGSATVTRSSPSKSSPTRSTHSTTPDAETRCKPRLAVARGWASKSTFD